MTGRRGGEHRRSVELRLVAEQVWPTVDPAVHRVSLETGADAQRAAERFRVVGRRGSIDMLVPSRPLAAARAMASYARLRPWRRRIARFVLAGAVGVGLPLPHRYIVLESADGTVDTVMRRLRETLGDDIDVAMHVRRAANRKALLQVVSGRGRTVGFAKLARSEASAAGITAETETLAALGGGEGAVRYPRVVEAGACGDMPYLLTEPLPRGIRAVSNARSATPSVKEFATVAPVVRTGLPRSTAQVASLRARARALPATAARDRVDRLLEIVESFDRSMSIAQRWHGDFAFWNVGRTADGTLWCWDFENTASDALAGLDIIHWHASRHRDRFGVDGVADVEGILTDASEALRAFGAATAGKRRLLYQVYVAEIAVRTGEAVALDGWTNVWVTEDGLVRLLDRAIAESASDALPQPLHGTSDP